MCSGGVLFKNKSPSEAFLSFGKNPFWSLSGIGLESRFSAVVKHGAAILVLVSGRQPARCHGHSLSQKRAATEAGCAAGWIPLSLVNSQKYLQALSPCGLIHIGLVVQASASDFAWPRACVLSLLLKYHSTAPCYFGRGWLPHSPSHVTRQPRWALMLCLLVDCVRQGLAGVLWSCIRRGNTLLAWPLLWRKAIRHLQKESEKVLPIRMLWRKKASICVRWSLINSLLQGYIDSAGIYVVSYTCNDRKVVKPATANRSIGIFQYAPVQRCILSKPFFYGSFRFLASFILGANKWNCISMKSALVALCVKCFRVPCMPWLSCLVYRLLVFQIFTWLRFQNRAFLMRYVRYLAPGEISSDNIVFINPVSYLFSVFLLHFKPRGCNQAIIGQWRSILLFFFGKMRIRE